jgi:D-alanyl-D-alanine dipeptidase
VQNWAGYQPHAVCLLKDPAVIAAEAVTTFGIASAEEIEASKQRYRPPAQAASVALWRADGTGKFVAVNGLEAISG